MITIGNKAPVKYQEQYVIFLTHEHGDADLNTYNERILKTDSLETFEELFKCYQEIISQKYFIDNNFNARKKNDFYNYLYNIIQKYPNLLKKFNANDSIDTICDFLWIENDAVYGDGYATIIKAEMFYFDDSGTKFLVNIS